MAKEDAKVWRTLHLKFTLPGADLDQLLSVMRSAAPFFQMFGNANFRLLRNADDPTRFIQVIEYETNRGLRDQPPVACERHALPDLHPGVARNAARCAGNRRLSGSLTVFYSRARGRRR